LLLLAGLALHRMFVWYKKPAPFGFPFVIDNGLWPLALILVGNATLVVTARVYV
jgi:hypothetical protein